MEVQTGRRVEDRVLSPGSGAEGQKVCGSPSGLLFLVFWLVQLLAAADGDERSVWRRGAEAESPANPGAIFNTPTAAV